MILFSIAEPVWFPPPPPPPHYPSSLKIVRLLHATAWNYKNKTQHCQKKLRTFRSRPHFALWVIKTKTGSYGSMKTRYWGLADFPRSPQVLIGVKVSWAPNNCRLRLDPHIWWKQHSTRFIFSADNGEDDTLLNILVPYIFVNFPMTFWRRVLPRWQNDFPLSAENRTKRRRTCVT